MASLSACFVGPPVLFAQDDFSNAPKEELPPDYKPPRAVPAVMKFNKELTTEDESKALYSELRKDRFTIVMSNGDASANGKKVLSSWASWQLNRMTLKSNRNKLHEIRADLMGDTRRAASSKSVPRKQTEAFRALMCDDLIKHAQPLLKNNFHVRLNAVLMLGQLNLTDETRTKDIPEQAYVKAAIPLLEVLKTPTGGGVDEQLEAVKIQAAIGLRRICLKGPTRELTPTLKSDIAKTLIAQLQNPNAHDWYQKRLLDALAAVDLENDTVSNKPIILQELGEVLADKKRHFCVRARAARSLGRCTLPNNINAKKLVFQILLLEYEMAMAYQKDPNAFYWLDCFADVYFAFHAESLDEIAMFGPRRPPGLNRKNLGGEAYQQMLPIARHVVTQDGWLTPPEGQQRAKNNPISDQLIANLVAWLEKNSPPDHKLAPSLPALDPTSPVPMSKAGTQTGE